MICLSELSHTIGDIDMGSVLRKKYGYATAMLKYALGVQRKGDKGYTWLL